MVITLTLRTMQRACGISLICYRTACWISASFERSGKEDVEMFMRKIREHILVLIMCEKKKARTFSGSALTHTRCRILTEGASFLASW